MIEDKTRMLVYLGVWESLINGARFGVYEEKEIMGRTNNMKVPLRVGQE